MSSDQPEDRQARQHQSIPLRNLVIPTEQHGSVSGPQGNERRLEPTSAQLAANLPGMGAYWDPAHRSHSDDIMSPESPIDPTALAAAMPFEYHPSSPSPDHNDSGSIMGETPTQYHNESDRVPLTSGAGRFSGSLAAHDHDPQPRDSFQTIRSFDSHSHGQRNTNSLGQDIESARGSTRHRSYGMSLVPDDTRSSRITSAGGAFQSAGSIIRAMSQRVVNISGESDVAVEQRNSRHRSRSPHRSFDAGAGPHDTAGPGLFVDTSYPSQTQPMQSPRPLEKGREQSYFASYAREPSPPTGPAPNPLKGNTLGYFKPNNKLRLWLCDILVHRFTEPIILLLIVAQTVLLAVEAAPNVFAEGNARPQNWGGEPIDWAMLGLFIIFTLEICARVIVSGFVLNAAQYSTIDRKKGVRAAIADQYRAVFQPERTKSTRGSRQVHSEPAALARSFTTFWQSPQAVPKTVEDQHRYRLARRAFLRHSFNRFDLLAVLAFWIDFTIRITGTKTAHHLHVFKMISCLRILRLLALTNGTAIILRSLKKATPLLVRVAFLISFFWLLFAIIGVQAFSSSLSRCCTWIDPLDPHNKSATYTVEFEFCGGYLDNATGEAQPWVEWEDTDDALGWITSGQDAKGFLCPRGSICLQQENPYNGTVSFDNILHSLELVFVIMSANTFSDLMYYTMSADFLPAALFFGAGIMIMTLWLTNLLIAVITSSFQVIREESKASAFTADQEPFRPPRADYVIRRSSALQRVYDKTRPVWILVILFGLIASACRSATMSDRRSRFIDVAETIATVALDVEIIVRLLADLRGFWRRWGNLVDLTLAVVTTVIAFPFVRHTRAAAWLSVFEVIRVYRLVLVIPVTKALILLVLGNATGIANLMIFVFLTTFLMAIFAAQLFRGEIPMYADGNFNEVSFFSLYNSFLGMYQILTSENWTTMLYDVTSYMNNVHTSWIGAIFLIGWFVIAFFIMVNMFIAVIQENFDVSEDEKRVEQVKAFLQRREIGNSSSNLTLTTIFGLGRSRQKKDPLDYGPAMMDMLLQDAIVKEFLDDRLDSLHDGSAAGGPPGPPQRSTTNLFGEVNGGILSRLWTKVVLRTTKREPNPFYSSNTRFDGAAEAMDPRQMAQQVVSAVGTRRKAQRDYLAKHPGYNKSLYLFNYDNPLRRMCQKLVGPARGSERIEGCEPNRLAWYTFSAFTYAATVAMVVLACVTTPLYQKIYQQEHDFSITNWYVWTDLSFTALFTLEAVIKVIADGLINTPNAYLRSSWGIIDGVVLITLWINVVTLFINDGAISRAVGAFKALRALRLLNFSESSRDIFHSLIIVGWWKFTAAAFLSISLLIPFAIYALRMFNGLLYSCNDSSSDIVYLNNCFGEFANTPYSSDWGMLTPRVSANPYFNFDNFGSALFTLFQIVSQEGWIDVSFASQAITGRDRQPQDLASQGNAVFFVIFNLMATVFILTLFISVFMRNYTEQTGVAFLTTEQRSWLELRKMLRQISPSKTSYKETDGRWRKWCHKRAIEKRGKWYQAITVLLCLHLVLLLTEYSTEPSWLTTARELVLLAFDLVYMANIIIRVLGLGWTRFRKSSWDVYALLVVFGAFFSTIAMLFKYSDAYQQVHKVFLVSIVLLLIPRNDALDQLFKTAAASVTVMGNLLLTWLVFFVVFAIAMTQTFSLTRFGENETNNINFRTVPKALILLFRMSLGEGWNQIMEDFAGIEYPLCVNEADFFNSDCGSKVWARFLFVAWNLLSMYIFVNLFVSLIYESFSYVYQRSTGVAAVDREEIRRFKEAWRSVDPHGTGFISKDAFPRLLGELSGVFRMKIYDPEDSVGNILDDVRAEGKMSRHMSFASNSATNEVDLGRLNERLSHLDVEELRERRKRFNLFYGEIIVSADPDKGIAFSTVLMTVAHYNIINDSKSLKLEEFLRRRARLQRVDEEYRRKTVQGFFDTLYWSRKFRKHMEQKRAGRMTAVPQLDVPHILVDDNGGDEMGGAGSGEGHVSMPPRLSLSGSPTEPWVAQHPLSFPPSAQADSHGDGAIPSTFSFELSEPGFGPGNHQYSTEAPAVPANQPRGVLDDSAWADSIRRSATISRSKRGSTRYGN